MPKRLALTALAALALPACVLPFVRFTAAGVPYYSQNLFEQAFNAWKTERKVAWQMRLRGSRFSQDELIIKSTGDGSLGPVLPGGTQTSKTFKLSDQELKTVIDGVVASGVLNLYDGNYAPYAQAGGQGGPELNISAGGYSKQVSLDARLVSPEASSINKAADAMLNIATPHLSGGGSPSPAPSPTN